MKKVRLVTLSCLVTLTWLITGSLVHAAPPVIKEFSSEGGKPRNKDNARDVMYLAKPGDKIVFKVKAEGSQGYEWRVDKIVQDAKTDTFGWTVPQEKGIWEIHLEVSNKDGKAHQEWVVSTLAKSEAPVIFDYFYPDRSQKDPWDRPLPKWDYKKDAKQKKIEHPDCTAHAYSRGVGRITIPSKNAYGTWIFQRKLRPKAEGRRKRGWFGWRISHGEPHYIYHKTANDEGFDFREIPSKYGPVGQHCFGCRSMGECCANMNERTDKWRQIRIIRTKEGWFYIWNGVEFWFDSVANENTLKEISSLQLYGPLLDGIQVYDYPVWPKKTIRLGQYRDDWGDGEKNKPDHEVKRTGIVITGHGATLKDIAEAIGDPKVFRYDQATRTATCYTDLVVDPASELIIDGETLKMHCNKDGEHQIRVKNGSIIRLNKATITSDNEFYYLWAFTSASRWEMYKDWSGYEAYTFSGRFLATDSTISNCGNFFPDTPGELVLKRCKFVNMVEVDAGNYWKCARGYYNNKKRKQGKGKKGMWFYNRKELVDFRIEDCTIGGKDKPIDMTFIGGDDLHKVTISNCRLDNIVARRGYRFRDWRIIYPYESEQLGCTVSLVNCKFKELKVQSGKAWVIPKYYLDVLVVDKAGKPVSGCRMRVVNEVDNVRRPAENLLEKRYWVSEMVTHNGWIKNWLDVNDMRTHLAVAGNGHSALPDDKANTLVLTDFVQDENGRQDFTYKVQVAVPDGRYGEVKGINPGPDWYRKDPDKPTRTIKVTVDHVAIPAEPGRKARPPVKTDKSPWPCFRGPDYAHTGRSPYVGPSKPHVLWRYKTGGQIIGYSPVIGPDGTIYITPSVPDSGIHAINPDGTRKWFYKNALAPSVGLDGTIYAGVVYRSRRRTLLAVSPEGKQKWEYGYPSYGMNQCYTIPGPDNTTYFVSTCRQTKEGKGGSEYRMYAMLPDGKVKWQCPIKVGLRWLWHGAHVSSPAIAPDGTIYVGGSGNFSGLHAIKPDGTVKWTCKAKGRTLSSPAISVQDKTVYIGCQQGGHPAVSKGITGHMFAIGFDGNLKWSFQVGDEVASSPAIGKDGTVYFGSRDGYFYALDKDGKEKWKFKAGDCIHSSAAIDAEGKIYFGSHDYYVYCLSPKGKLLWKYLTGGSVVSSPAIGADGTVYIGSADGYLYAFGK